jgi:PAS domain S-box-containing protein
VIQDTTSGWFVTRSPGSACDPLHSTALVLEAVVQISACELWLSRLKKLGIVSNDQAMRARASELESTLGHEGAVAILDSSGRVISVGRTMQEITGYPPERFIDGDPFELIHPEDRDHVMGILECSLMALDIEMAGLFRIVHPDGHWRWFEMQCRNLTDDPSVGGVVVRLHDRTEP